MLFLFRVYCQLPAQPSISEGGIKPEVDTWLLIRFPIDRPFTYQTTNLTNNLNQLY